jgi:uncharacterized membrane protein YfcA
LTLGHHAAVAVAGFVASTVNALAGGGAIINFPTLLSVGLPGVIANATMTVATCPGYAGASWAQRGELRGEGRRIAQLCIVAGAGGLIGGMLLLATGEALFMRLVPWLILFACALLLLQEKLRSFGSGHRVIGWLVMFAAAIYGGYFGAGMSVIVLGAMSLAYAEPLTRLNALKQCFALAANAAAALWLALHAALPWTIVGTLACGALAGGIAGGHIARSLSARTLRAVIVGLGIVLAGVYFWRGFGVAHP